MGAFLSIYSTTKLQQSFVFQMCASNQVWPDGQSICSKFGPLVRSMKTCPRAQIFAKVSPYSKLTLKQISKTFEFLTKVAKFRQIWPHCFHRCWLLHCCLLISVLTLLQLLSLFILLSAFPLNSISSSLRQTHRSCNYEHFCVLVLWKNHFRKLNFIWKPSSFRGMASIELPPTLFHFPLAQTARLPRILISKCKNYYTFKGFIFD